MKNKLYITRRPDKRTRTKLKEIVRHYELKKGSKINRAYKNLTKTADNNYIFYRMKLNSNEALGKF